MNKIVGLIVSTSLMLAACSAPRPDAVPSRALPIQSAPAAQTSFVTQVNGPAPAFINLYTSGSAGMLKKRLPPPDNREYEFAVIYDEQFGLVQVASGALGEQVGVKPPPGVNAAPLEAPFDDTAGVVDLKSGFSYGFRAIPGKLQQGLALDVTRWPTPWRHVVTKHVSTGAYDTRYVALSSPSPGGSPNPHPLGHKQRTYWHEGIVKVVTNNGKSVASLVSNAYVQCDVIDGFPSLTLHTNINEAHKKFCDDAKAFFDEVIKAEKPNEGIWRAKYEAIKKAEKSGASP